MQPFFFGISQKPLFGIYQAPLSGPTREAAVVLCYPAPQEYVPAYRSFRRLGTLLAGSGFHVLRFDYTGTGDSGGDSTDASLSQWRKDIGIAARELLDMSGTRKVTLVGARLGAALAAEQAAAEEMPIQDLVLWDPVVVGKEYLAELEALHRRLFDTKADRNRDSPLDRCGELLGYPSTSRLLEEVSHVNLLDRPLRVAARVCLVVTEQRDRYLDLAENLKGKGIRFEYRYVPDATEWGRMNDLVQAFLLNDVLHEIASIVAGP